MVHFRATVCKTIRPMLPDRFLSYPVCLPVWDVGEFGSNAWMDQHSTWYECRLQDRPHCVRRGPSSPERGTVAAYFSANVYCGQTARWIKVSLSTEVGLSPGHIVLDGDPPLPQGKGHMSIVAKRRPSHLLLSSSWLKVWLFAHYLFFSDVVVSHSTTPQPTSAPSGRSTSIELAISDYVLIPQTKLEFSVISPPGFSRQAYVMLLLLSFFFFFNDLLEQRDLGNYTSIFIKFLRDSRHVHVDVQSGNRFSVSQGRLPWQPILGAKSTEIGDTPSFLGLAFHKGWQYGKADERINSTSCRNLVNFAPLTLKITVINLATICAPNMGEIETRSILGTRIRQWIAGTAERICAKFTPKTCLVLRSDEFECQDQRSKVKITRDKNVLWGHNS